MLPDVLGLDDVEHGVDVLRGVFDELCADDALEDLLLVRLVLGGVDHAGAVDQVDLLHQFDVLPDLWPWEEVYERFVKATTNKSSK